jgi:beta-glucosidase
VKCTKEYRLSFTEKAREIVGRMTLEEKVFLMGGWIGAEPPVEDDMQRPGTHYNYLPFGAGGCRRLGLGPMLFCDGPRGVVCGTGESTCFPVSMLRGASFDEELEEEIGRAIGREVLAHGGNLFAGVCINLPYNPGWGRSQETYGEDSFAIGRMGAALVRGVQSENVIACVKHFAFNSMELSRFKVSVDCDRRTEREVYLSHFKDCIDAGAAAVMSAYNKYKGVHCGHSDYLLRKVLKEEWDFDGFVMSDFNWGIRDTVEARKRRPGHGNVLDPLFRARLVEAVRKGLVPEERINDAAVRITRTLLAFEAARAEAGPPARSVVGCREHVELALRSAREGITLLKNGGALPLDRSRVKKLAVIGKLAAEANTGDHGSSQVFPAYVTAPLEGLKLVAPDTELIYLDGADTEAAKAAAAAADAVVFGVGVYHADEGEYVGPQVGALEEANGFDAIGGDRKDGLGLHRRDVELIKAVGPANPRSAVVLIGGNTLMITEWLDCIDAVLMAYYPGQEGGRAIAEILFGDVNPSGKLPFVLPRSEADLPRVNWETANQWYGYYHGYAKLDREGVKPLLPYGFGLSYTTFSFSGARFGARGGRIYAPCPVANTRSRAGTEVVQLYVGFGRSRLDRPARLLRGFKRVELAPGESREVVIECPVEKLKYYNPKTASFELEDMEYEVFKGSSEAEEELLKGVVRLGPDSVVEARP